jgi:hypothetical protein
VGSVGDDVSALIASEGGIEQACAAIAARRLKEVGRDLVISPYDYPGPDDGPRAVWMATKTTDYILYPACEPPDVRERLIAQELRVMLAAPTEHDATATMLELLADSELEPEVIRHIFR